jgi:branched-chain amino acid aminotransferase
VKFIFNGSIFEDKNALFGSINRAFLYGDYISEFAKVSNGNILLWEEHYFNLMASMRIFRMKIPDSFTQEFLGEEVQKVLKENNSQEAKIRISIFRNTDNDSLLTKATVSYLVEIVHEFSNPSYTWNQEYAEIDIFKDYTINPSFFTQVNSHKPEEIIAFAYMQENEFQDLVFLNPEKRIARTVLGVPFLIQGNTVKTPKLSEGGIRSVTRNHLCQLLEKSTEFQLEENEIFPFELQKTDEVFVLMESEGIQSIHQNRKKMYNTEKTKEIYQLMNSSI